MASLQGPLRRWKRFLPAFASIDAAIEAAGQGLSRGEFREARYKILEVLCDATDDAVAEKICVVLDEAMIESLLTLELVPAMPTMLSSTDLAENIGALTNHESGRVRDLAAGILREWKKSVKAELDKAAAAMEKLSQVVLQPEETGQHAKILEPPAAKKTAKAPEPSLSKKTGEAPKLPLPKKIAKAPEPSVPKKSHVKNESPPEKASGLVGSSRRGSLDRSCNDDETTISATKRKLREGYQEAEDAKRQRRIHVIEAPAMAKQRLRKTHPVLKQRNRSSCAVSTAKRASHTSSRHCRV